MLSEDAARFVFVCASTAARLPAASPPIDRLYVASVALGLPQIAEHAAAVIGVPAAQFSAARADAWQAHIDVPPGTWRMWPKIGVALWVGRRVGAVPARPPGSLKADMDLREAVRLLVRDGLWPTELRFSIHGEWKTGRSLAGSLRLFATEVEIDAVYGVWTDKAEGLHRIALYRSGEVRADSPALAERASIVAGGLTYG
jgi:hypothetical protein